MRIAPSGGQRDHGKPGLLQAYGEMVGMQGEQPVKLCFRVFKGPDQKGTGRACAVPAHDCGTVTCSTYKIYRGRSPRHIARLALKKLDTPSMRSSVGRHAWRQRKRLE